MISKTVKLMLLSLIFISSSFAAELEVEADNSLEWHREEKLYIAKGNAKASQDGKSILADTLYAHYNETEESKVDISKIEAKGNVLITSGVTKILGDNGIYDLETQIFTITGESLDILSEKYQIKANKKIVYFEADNKIEALGDVVVYQENNEMHCDKLTSLLDENDAGDIEVSKLFAEGNVEITTKTDKITGDKGFYDMKSETSEIEGGVIIARSDSVIIGDKATVNMKTGIAKMLSTSKDARVKAVFVTKDK